MPPPIAIGSAFLPVTSLYIERSVLKPNVYFDYSKLDLFNAKASVKDNKLTIVKTNYEISSGVAMDRNYTNTGDVEYYLSIDNSGWYAVSDSVNATSVFNSSYIYAEESGIIYYSPSGYNTLNYKVYSLDGAYITDMVYYNGSAYAKLPTFNYEYGYYVVDNEGNRVATYNL